MTATVIFLCVTMASHIAYRRQNRYYVLCSVRPEHSAPSPSPLIGKTQNKENGNLSSHISLPHFGFMSFCKPRLKTSHRSCDSKEIKSTSLNKYELPHSWLWYTRFRIIILEAQVKLHVSQNPSILSPVSSSPFH